jgi:putative endonuclease
MMGLLYRAADALRRRAFRDDHGRIGEDLAHRYLRRRGCSIVARNYRPPSGGVEIDIVAWQGETLVFVEVKTRAAADCGAPDRAVDAEKRERVNRAARDYARRAGVVWEKTRFDILGILLEKPPRIEWIRDAWRDKRRTPASRRS